MLGAIAMVLTLLGMLGVGGLWGMSKIQDQSDAFLDNSFAEMQHLGRLQEAMSTVREAEKDMIIQYERPEEVEKAYTRWKSHLAEVDVIADGPGGLARGLVFSACALWVGAALATRQKAL